MLLLLVNTVLVVASQENVLHCDPCIDRPSYRIQVIAHGISDDPFWQRMRASSIQAGKDMRVEVDFELYGESVQCKVQHSTVVYLLHCIARLHAFNKL